MITVPDFKKRKLLHQKLSMITCYDASFAQILSESPIDILLIGDSSSMVMQGYDSTIHSTLESVAFFTAAVSRGSKQKKFIVADMPFLTTRKSLDYGVEAAGILLKNGAHAVKIEGIRGNEKLVSHLTESGIPVMGHLGLTPQSVNQLGGYRLQGRSPAEAERFRAEAHRVAELGAFAVVFECVPAALAKTVTDELAIATIGIGAGADTSGQVLVLTDLLGLDDRFRPRFARNYLDGHDAVLGALNRFADDVRAARFPARAEVIA